MSIDYVDNISQKKKKKERGKVLCEWPWLLFLSDVSCTCIAFSSRYSLFAMIAVCSVSEYTPI